jgi:hypothetical protein
MTQYTFALPATGGTGGFDPIDNALTAGATDAELVYNGNDSIVWDRVNSARLRRGLPGLSAIGFPRPSGAVNGNPDVQTFTVQGPPGLTEAQARQIFQQQNQAGSLVGLKPGNNVNALTQLAGGLPGAAGQVSQAAVGIGGSALGAITGGLNSNTLSASGLAQTVAGGGLTSTSAAVLNGITGVVQNTPVTNGINPADFASQAPALASIEGLSAVDVRAGMAQASKLVGQDADQISDALGAGKFGMDATQLEAAGLLKAGTAATYLSQGANSLTSVLSSPAVWTGKNGATNLDNFLSSPSLQDLSFENLMQSGMAALKGLGAPLDALSAGSLTGVALNAAKSVGDTLAWAKGESLPAGVKGAFDTAARDGAFAANFADTKLNGAMLLEVPAAPAIATADRSTVDAAAVRVVGNEKVPEADYGAPVAELSRGELTRRFSNGLNFLERVSEESLTAARDANQAISSGNPSAAFDYINKLTLLQADLTAASGKFLERQRNAENLDPPATDLANQYVKLREESENFIKTIDSVIAQLRQRATAALAA